MTNATDALRALAEKCAAAVDTDFDAMANTLCEVADALLLLATPAGSASGEDAKDAARYRFIRREHQSIGRSIHVRYPSNDPFDEDLDAAIDAAIQGSANGQG